MSKYPTSWLILGLLVFLAMLTFWMDYTVRPLQSLLGGRLRHAPDFIVRDFSATELGPDGQPQSILSAATMTHFPDTRRTQLEQPRFTHLEGGKPVVNVQADKGEALDDGQQVIFHQNVIVRAQPAPPQEPWTATTQYLHALPQQQILDTPAPVTLVSAHMQVHATGLQANAKTRVVKLLSNVHVKYEPATRP